jgi:RNA-binding protein YlmH
VRLDTYLSLMLAATAGESSASRAKVQDAIKAGLVSVNG